MAKKLPKRKGIMVRCTPALWRALKLLALDRGETLQKTLMAAIEEYLARHSPK
jgi:hypothetical protein